MEGSTIGYGARVSGSDIKLGWHIARHPGRQAIFRRRGHIRRSPPMRTLHNDQAQFACWRPKRSFGSRWSEQGPLNV